MMKPDRVWAVLFVLLLAFIAGSGCVDSLVNQTASNNGSSAAHTQKENSPFRSNTDPNTVPIETFCGSGETIGADVTDPNTVPIETAYNQTHSTFWGFTIDGPYAPNVNWTSAALDPEPSIIYDVNGEPLYYEFYLRNTQGTPGYFWTAANKILGFPVFRIYESAPTRNYSLYQTEAEPIIKTRYPDYPILSKKPVIYNEPNTGTMFTILNTTSGADEKIIIDDYTHEIVPDHPSDDYKGHAYAWSFLDNIPESEHTARIAQWELQDSNASRIVGYAMSQGIDVRLPLSERSASIIGNYYAAESPDAAMGMSGSRTEPDDRPVTEELIAEHIVPVETARENALAVLLRIVADRPDSYASRSWRNASLSKKDPVIIEDFEGRKLYYVFGVERNGIAVSDIIIAANKGLYSHPRGLETPAGEYDLVNATRKAREKAAQDYPGYSVRSIRPVYSLADNCCHNVTVMMELENPQTRGINRILVDTYTLNRSVEPVAAGTGTGAHPSLFSTITSGDFAENAARWEQEHARARSLTGYAEDAGIDTDRPLADEEIIALGTYMFRTDTKTLQQALDPVYPAPGIRAVPDERTRVWQDHADWACIIFVDGDMNDAAINWLVKGYQPDHYTLRIYPVQGSGGSYSYYLMVPEADYNRTFAILREDGSVFAPGYESGRTFVTTVKKKNGTITIPLGIASPMEANVLRLAQKGVILRPMKMVQVNLPDQAREKVLAALSDDERVLFAMKEYLEGS